MELPRSFIEGLIFLLILHDMIGVLQPATPGNEADRLTLLSFKDSLSDSSYGALSSWNETLHYCNWRGVSCGGRLHPDRVTALDLVSVNLVGTIPPSITNLTFLRKLDLSNNKLSGRIPRDLGRLFRLKFLNLSYNSLDGEIPTSLTDVSSLQLLHLGANHLEGRIPASLSNCTELVIISLRANRLHGEVPPELSTLPKLVRLILGSNNLTGGIPPSLGNLSTLSILDLADNHLDGSIPSSVGQLASLGAFQIGINQLSGTIPPSIYNLSSIWHFHVSTNHLHGSLPPDIGTLFPQLQNLLMIENQFEGPIPASLSNASNLLKIELAGNRFSGRVPSNLGVLHNLVEVLLASNQLEDGEAYGWSFLTSLTNCTSLQSIDLYDNKLHGRFPDSIANLSLGLRKLSMNRNQISGSIPPGIGNLVNLASLYLEQNLLTGAIPDTIGKLQNLHVLSLHENRFSGQIPPSMGNLTLLTELTLGECEFVGNIPTTFGNLQSLEYLNLSSNKLTGSIPKEVVGLSYISIYLDLSRNFLHGYLPVEVGNLKNIELLDVSENKLSGEIPSALGECQIMVYLYMEGNQFQGVIPPSLSGLKGIEELDVSRNNLSGNIPVFLEKLQNLRYLNLSFNEFEGEVPKKGIFGNLSAISLESNGELCGDNPGLHLKACSLQLSMRRHRFPRVVKIILAVSGVLCFSLLLCFFVARCWIQKSRTNVASTASLEDHQFQKVTYAELLRATDGFSSANLIGTGSFGSVYKGVLGEEENIVAVKVLNLQQKGASKSFMAECEALRNVRHRNLIKILTACSSVDFKGNAFKALVFTFMPNGSLEQWLHPEVSNSGLLRNLGFVQRLNIAIDVASALDYLHHHAGTPVAHCDLKPSNVLLDNDMTAHVGDFGLAKLLSKNAWTSSGHASSSVGLKGSIGYVAPEYGMGSEVSLPGDVYSFGILLLEMLTGRRPTDDTFRDGLSLHKYVQMALPPMVLNIIDPRILFEEEDESDKDIDKASEQMHKCLFSLIRIGLSCSKESPRERMAMDDVLRELKATRDAFYGR